MKKITVISSKPKIITICGKIILPLANVFSADEYEELEENEVFSEMVELGYFKVKNAESLADVVNELTVVEAEEIIVTSTDKKALLEVIDTDARKGVISACEDRLEELADAKEKGELPTGFVE